MSNSILVTGTVLPKMIGDGLLYAASVKLLNQRFPNDKITLMSQGLENSQSIFQGLSLNARLLDSTNLGYLFTWKNFILPLLKKPGFARKNSQTNLIIQNASSKHVLYDRRVLYDKFSRYSPPLWQLDRSLSVHMLTHKGFDAGMIVGHTLSVPSPQSFLVTYELTRSIVNGPTITFPISISSLALQETLSSFNRGAIFKKMANILERFDFIYVRGRRLWRF